MSTLLFLATEASGFAASAIGSDVLRLLLSLGGTMAVLTLLMRGFVSKYGDDYLKKFLETWFTSEDTKKKQEAFLLDSVTRWYTSDLLREDRKRFTKEVVENETRRDDGIIRKEIEDTMQNTAKTVLSEIKELSGKVEQGNILYNQILQRLSHIEGSVDVVKNAFKLSSGASQQMTRVNPLKKPDVR